MSRTNEMILFPSLLLVYNFLTPSQDHSFDDLCGSTTSEVSEMKACMFLRNGSTESGLHVASSPLRHSSIELAI